MLFDGMNKNIWENRKAAIIIHESTTGPGHDLRDYLLKQRIHELLFIAHPLLYLKDGFQKVSHYKLYKNGILVNKNSSSHFFLPEPILYIKDIIYSLVWCLRSSSSFDVVIGVGNLDAFAACMIKSFGKAKRSIYYVIDYVPRRFRNKIINWLYHWVEQYAASHSDYTWNLSPRMIEARENKWQRIFPNQLVVPHGVHFKRIKRVPFSHINKAEIIYMGSLLKKQGIQIVIQSLPAIARKIPNIKLTIIGRGPYGEDLKKFVQSTHTERYVTFLGYIEKHEEVENRIAKAAIALALYVKEFDDFSYYADPGKIKNYLGAGVPVIMTDVPHVAREIYRVRCGFIVKYNKEEIIQTLIKFFRNPELLKEYRKNALLFAKHYDWERVFTRALKHYLLYE